MGCIAENKDICVDINVIKSDEEKEIADDGHVSVPSIGNVDDVDVNYNVGEIGVTDDVTMASNDADGKNEKKTKQNVKLHLHIEKMPKISIKQNKKNK